jgi:hypothetical protein
MAVLKGDQFFRIDPAQPPKSGAALKVVKLSIGDVNGNKVISPNSGDLIGGLKVTAVWVKDTITVDMGNGPVTVVGVTFYVQGGGAVFTPTDGTILYDARLVSTTYVVQSTQVSIAAFGPPCFTHGTMISTPLGECAVQELRVGDMVVTRDHGPQTLRWVGERSVCGTGRFAPIHFLPGAVGNRRDLLVSPQHRMLISGWRAELFFGEAEVLVPAKQLVNGRTVLPFLTPVVDYFHLLFDQHEIVFAEGAPTESFYPGGSVLAADRDIYVEVLALFPALSDTSRAWPFAAPVISGLEAGVLRQ